MNHSSTFEASYDSIEMVLKSVSRSEDPGILAATVKVDRKHCLLQIRLKTIHTDDPLYHLMHLIAINKSKRESKRSAKRLIATALLWKKIDRLSENESLPSRLLSNFLRQSVRFLNSR